MCGVRVRSALALFTLALVVLGTASVPSAVAARPPSVRATAQVLGEIDAFACPSARFCVAVLNGPRSHLATFDPTRTPLRPHLRLFPGGILFDVACGTPRYCVAVNGRGAMVWNGTRWSGLHSIIPRQRTAHRLSCAPGSRFCMLTTTAGAVFVHHKGRWVRATAVPGHSAVDSLSCALTHFCMVARGSHVFQFDGRSWHRASKGLPTGRGPELSLACAGPRFCAALGWKYAYHYNGTLWRRQRVKVGSLYHALACWTTGRCVALADVGTVRDYRHGRWGKPHRVATPSQYPAIACASNGMCLATTGVRPAFVRRTSDGRWHRPVRIR